MKIAAIVLILLFLFAPAASAITRTMTLEADGTIEMNSVTENTTSKAGFDLQGQGQIVYQSETAAGENSIDQAYHLEARSEGLRPLQATTALQEGGNVYALMMKPDRGEAGLLDVLYLTNLRELSVTATAIVSRGTFRNYLNIYNPDGVGLREAIRILGQVYYMDLLTMEKDDELNETGDE
jgi:hypothetical protein